MRPAAGSHAGTREVSFRAGEATLAGTLAVPDEPRGAVVFAHGSGSGRHSPRNRRVASALGAAGLATLLVDLLSEDEERVDRETGELRFDVALLARRLGAATDRLAGEPSVRDLPVGYFGASTGAAAAIVAAVERPETRAVVSRGGRPDLAGEALPRLRTPTLLVVGGNDAVVLELNRQAVEAIPAEKRLEIVPGAGHLFEEPGALDAVSGLAREWFTQYLPGR